MFDARTNAVACMAGLVLAALLAAPRAAAGQTRARAPAPPRASQASVKQPISRIEVERVLGGSPAAGIRVVSKTGIDTVKSTQNTLHVNAGDFVFRKIGPSAKLIAVALPSVQPNVHLTEPAPPKPSPPPAGARPAPGSGMKAQSGTPTGTGGSGASGRLDTPHSHGDRDAIYVLPYRWLTIDEQGVRRVLRPIVHVEGGGLVYDSRARIFRGAAFIGVEDSLHQQEGNSTLPRPLKMLLTLTRPGEVQPRNLAIGHTSLDYEPITIHATESDSVQVRVQTATDMDGVYIPVPVYRPKVRLTILPQAIQGFGLATASVSIALPPGIARSETLTVRFTSPDVSIRPGKVMAVADGDNTAIIRSGRPGRHTVTAEIDGLAADTQPIDFVWPWSFLSAALSGVLLGGAATFVGGKRRKRASALPYTIAKGVPFGLLTALAGALGLDWMQLKLDDAGAWIAVMLTAALGAWAGRRILDKAAPLAGG